MPAESQMTIEAWPIYIEYIINRVRTRSLNLSPINREAGFLSGRATS